jgi:hypothetical protein
MGKRSNFERIPRDFYPTPVEAVTPLLAHLTPTTKFCEPCAGDGALIDYLRSAGHVCAVARDIEPRRDDIERKDALTTLTGNVDCFITNPPWDRKVLHPLIVHLSDQAPTWLLFDADWIHTRQAMPFLARLRRIVSVGRVKWIPESKMTGKDNCAWHLFDEPSNQPATFYGRK